MKIEEFEKTALRGFDTERGETIIRQGFNFIEIVENGIRYEGTDRFELLGANIPRSQLVAALEVITCFRVCESSGEFAVDPLSSWIKLESLQEQLQRMIRLEDARPIIGLSRKAE